MIILNNDEIIFRMLNENEDQFVAALKSDLNKPFQESITSEIDMLKNVKYSSKVSFEQKIPLFRKSSVF